MANERCPTCAGPAEGRPAPFSESGEPVIGRTFHALPDTLKGIEADASESKNEWREGAVRQMWDALRRLFNGCATCGREPTAAYQELYRQDWTVALGNAKHHAKRQAYQQALALFENSGPYVSNTWEDKLESFAADLRKLAEGE